MNEDVCQEQRLYDEFLEELQEAVLELLGCGPASAVEVIVVAL